MLNLQHIMLTLNVTNCALFHMLIQIKLKDANYNQTIDAAKLTVEQLLNIYNNKKNQLCNNIKVISTANFILYTVLFLLMLK